MVSAVDSLLVTPPPTTAPAPAPATHHLAPPSHGFAAQTLPEVDELDHTGGMVNDGGSAGNGGVTRDVARAAEKEAAGVSPPLLNPEKTLSGMVSVPGELQHAQPAGMSHAHGQGYKMYVCRETA